MEKFEIEAKKREVGKKANRALAKNKMMPAIVYGHGLENQAVAVSFKDFEKVFKKAGTNTLIWLDMDSNKKQVLIYDYQRDPVSAVFLHVDFYAVNMKEQITADVPLKFTGISLAVKDNGGVLVKNMEELKIKCLPKDLPHEIEVDLSALKTFEDRIRILDLKIPAGVEVVADDKKQIIAIAVLPKAEEEAAGKPEENVQAVEGIKPKEGEIIAEGSKKDKKEGQQREVKKEPKSK